MKRQRVIVDDYRAYSGRVDIEEFKDITTIVGIPLLRGERLLGVIAVVFKDEVKTLDERVASLMDQFAAAASIALDNARLHEEARREAEVREKAERDVLHGYARLQKIFSDVIRTMGEIVGKKDPYTIEHQERVAELAAELCKRAGLGAGRCEGLRIAGLVHDIGKIEIPGEILSKPGKLSQIEFELIKGHAQSGYDILKEVDFPWPVAEIARQHHERLDGSGYPRGLKGEDILPEARVLAVADVVEAMVSHRPYRPSLGVSAALDEIKDKRGVLYDPEVVDACIALFDEQPGFLLDGLTGG
ncbi:MAG: Cyclic di-GMP phosphodiesterase response regulator RpfG [Synergistetes bacterium ADurb.BinA166]|jgi:putative nucleotidyltransferase with HDIG domain|nr:MAG: Cyclic di-GMP phosphodiesterase response regulator RpfG [Synergistetes bacterium ADurb.BinA166]